MSRQRKAKNKTNLPKNGIGNEEQPSNCIICMETVSCRGKLSVCKHWFCFHCIFEWSKNTNTCPICKTRFRCISKVHLSPFKSPPKQVRVPDKDQRVWNDDDDIAAADLMDVGEEMESDDFDDDYEPSIHVTNPWSRQAGSHQDIDEYDFNDSFINDNEVTLVEDDKDDENSSDEECVMARDSPYLLRRGGQVPNVALMDSTIEVSDRDDTSDEEFSPASTESFIESDDDDDVSDYPNHEWIPVGNSSVNSDKKNPKYWQTIRGRKTRAGNRSTKPAKKRPKSQTTVGHQVSTRSKSKGKDMPEEACSSGWIDMTARREYMRALGSSRAASGRECARKKNQRSALQESLDVDFEQNSASIADNAASVRRKGKEKHRGKALSNKSTSTALQCNGKTRKAQTLPEESDSDENNSDDLSIMTSRSKIGRNVLQPYNTDNVTTSRDLKLKAVVHLHSRQSKKLQPLEDQSSENDGDLCSGTRSLIISNRIKRKKETKNKTKGNLKVSVVIQDVIKESQCCTARIKSSQGEEDLPSSCDEGCIAPTPQSHKYYSILKRRHKSPAYTFDYSADGQKVPKYSSLSCKPSTSKADGGTSRCLFKASVSGKSWKSTVDINNELCATKTKISCHQGDSPLLVRTGRKRIRQLDSDSDSD